MTQYCVQGVKLESMDKCCSEVCDQSCHDSFSPEDGSTDLTRTRSFSSDISQGSAWSESAGKMKIQQVDAVYSHLYTMRKAGVEWQRVDDNCNLCNKSACERQAISCTGCASLICRDCFAQVMVIRLKIEDYKTICYGCPWCPEDILRVDVVTIE